MNHTDELPNKHYAASAVPPFSLTAASALLLALTVAACGQQDNDTVEGQGEVPIGQEDTQTQPAPSQKPGASGGMQKQKPTASSDSMSDVPPGPLFMSLDSNGDGLVSVSEAKQESGLVKNFNELDTNGDGQLSTQEFTAFASGGARGKR